MSVELDPQVRKLSKLCAKQKQEIARLTREVEQLRADKRNLTFDINKLKVANDQLRNGS